MSIERLSRTQIRKRLSRAGIRGAALPRMVNEILAGPDISTIYVEDLIGERVLGWPTTVLKRLIGWRAYRQVVGNVHREFKIVVIDEFSTWTSPGVVEEEILRMATMRAGVRS